MPPTPRAARRRLLRRAGIAAVLLALLAATSCSDGDGDESAEPIDLGRHLPAAATSVVLVDVDAGRDAYDLPDDAALDFRSGSIPFNALLDPALPVGFDNGDQDVIDAVDTGAIHAAAVAYGPFPRVTVLRTGQPWDDLVGALVEAGWEHQDEVLVRTGSAVARKGDLWVWGTTKDEVITALDQDAGPTVLDAMDDVDGEVVVGTQFDRGGDQGCVTTVVVGQEAATNRGRLLLKVDGSASWVGAEDRDDSWWQISDAEVEAGELTADLTVPGNDPSPTEALQALLNFQDPTDLISCG